MPPKPQSHITISNIKSPCKGCQDRGEYTGFHGDLVPCHSICTKYIEYKNAIIKQKINRNEQTDVLFRDYIRSVIRKQVKYHYRNNRR